MNSEIAYCNHDKIGRKSTTDKGLFTELTGNKKALRNSEGLFDF